MILHLNNVREGRRTFIIAVNNSTFSWRSLLLNSWSKQNADLAFCRKRSFADVVVSVSGSVQKGLQNEGLETFCLFVFVLK